MSDIPPPPPGDVPPPPPPPPGPMGGPPPPPPGAGLPRPAELTDRFLARLIDGVGGAIVIGIIYAVLHAVILGDNLTCSYDNDSVFSYSCDYGLGRELVFYLFYSVLSTAIWLGYYGFMQSSQGATVGQQVMKLKVVGPDGVGNPTMEQALRRNAFYALGLIAIIPIAGWIIAPLLELGAVIYIAVTINQDTVNRQGWHDKFAGGTRVLKVG